MDFTQKQQTVNKSMDSQTSFPQDGSITPDVQTDKPYESLSYDELFPALPNAGLPQASARDRPPATGWANNSDMRIASSVITQVFRIPVEEQAKIEGNSTFGESVSSRICTDITAKTGAHIEISMAKDLSLTFVVTGKSDQVVKAKKHALEKFQTQARQMVMIPKEHHKIILGRRGKRLQELATLTGTKIQMPDAVTDSDEVYVFGSKESIERAVHELKVISDEQSKQAYEKLDIPRIYHVFICGPNNETVNQLMSQHNVRINLPPPNMDKSEVSIAGEKEGVMKCKEIINNIYREMEKKSKTVSVEVPKHQHKHVNGVRGCNISEILQKTGVSVEIPFADNPAETITLRGPANKLGEALTMVYTKATSIIIETFYAPTWTHKFVIGKKGTNIRQITQDLPKVHVEFTDTGNIQLEGPPEDVEAVALKIKEITRDIEDRFIVDKVDVNPAFFKMIIGKGGANINRIRQDTGATMQLVETSGNPHIVIEGLREGVAKAKMEILEVILKQENEKEREIIIDQRFHRNLIGQKGDYVREIRDKFNQVQIKFPESGENSDIVKIRGVKEDVDKCFSYMTKLVEELKEKSYVAKVAIFRQLHRFIIGKAGATINKLRDETNARIDLPSEGSNSDEIVISGRKADVEKAKQRILQMQDELAHVVEMDIIIPSKFHNALIGTGGKLVQSISEDCGGVRITFPPPASKSDKVSIRGPKDDVIKAKQILVDMSNEKQLSGYTEEIRANPQLHRFLIGRNGVNIRKIRNSTGTRISLPTEKDEQKDIITIMGKKESVQKAKEELMIIITELDNVVESFTSVDTKHHRHFVARQGAILHQITEQFGGVTISFPRQGVNSDKVAVKGSKECVEGAIARIQEIATELDNRVTVEVIINQKHHRAIMGPRGSKVKGISADYEVMIKFPDKDMEVDDSSLPNGTIERPQDIVVIQGKKENCEKATAALLAYIPVTEDVTVPFKHHKYIIGVKGDNIRAISTDYDVQVRVPPVQDKKDAITLIGNTSNVEAAREALLQKVKELEADEVDRLARSFQVHLQIDPDYHPRIIGKKGAVISKIRDKYQVQIQFPPKGSQDRDIITIVGYEKNCIDAKKAILNITGDLENMVTDTVEIDPRIHSRLIGVRGRSIRKVMEDFKVEIKFPREEGDPRMVTISGNANNVEECKEQLTSMADDYMQDIDEEEDLKRYLSSYSSTNGQDKHSGRSSDDPVRGFVVTGAPWTQDAPQLDSSEDFPSIGSIGSTPTMAPAWGPKRA